MFGFYFVCFAISFFLSVIYIFKWHSRNNIYISLIFVFCTIGNLGYWLFYTSKSLEAAIISNYVLYIGGSFSSLCIMLSIFELCGLKYKQWINGVLFLINFTIYGFCLTVGKTPWFYKVFEISFVNGQMEIYKEYGFAHSLFYLMIVVYTIASFVCLVYSAIKKRKQISVNNISLLFGILFFNVVSFFAGKKIFNVDLLPVTYDISFLLFLIISGRLPLYNVDENIAGSLSEHKSVGFASFDKKGRYLGCNSTAAEYYPVLKKLTVDFRVDENNPDFEELITWMKNFEAFEKPVFNYNIGDKYYSANFLSMSEKGQEKGIHIVFRDRTNDRLREAELLRLSHTDELTGLGNRRAFIEDLSKVPGSQDDLILVSVDLNGLKETNDYFGHASGDDILVAAGETLKKSFGHLGKVYRTGGDEFAGLLFCSEEEFDLAKKEIWGYVGRIPQGEKPVLSLSFGAVSRKEFPYISVSELVKESDQRMYIEKNAYYEKTSKKRRRY